MRRDLVVLHELSLGAGQIPPHAVKEFGRLLLEIRKALPRAALVTAVPLWGSGVSAYGFFGDLIRDPATRDWARVIMAVQNVAPFAAESGDQPFRPDGDEEWRENREACIGLAYAAQRGLLSVSILSDDRFDTARLTVEHLFFIEDTGELVSEEAELRHAARAAHVLEHRDWLLLGDDGGRHAAAVWSERAALFPNLTFLDRVEADLRDLGPIALDSVVGRLRELQDAVRRWNPAVEQFPRWRSKVTPESQSRIAQGVCRFAAHDGAALVDYSLHARYTPGAGRIHLDLDRAAKVAVIAYVGPKR